MRRAAILAVLSLAGCGGGDDRATVYLPRTPGDALPNQVAPLLVPVKRADALRALREALPGTRIRSVHTSAGTAVVDLAGREPHLSGSAAIVFTLMEDPAVQRVRLTLDGEPCCVWMMNGMAASTASRADFHGWTGEPCAFRDETVRRCRK